MFFWAKMDFSCQNMSNIVDHFGQFWTMGDAFAPLAPPSPLTMGLSHMMVTNTVGFFSMGTLGNVPPASAHGCCIVTVLSCIQWKAEYNLHVLLVDIKVSK